MARPPVTSGSPKPPTSSRTTRSTKEPLLTQENFEKELRELALKAKEETMGKWALEQVWILAQSGVLLILAALYSNVSLLSLSPVYGGIPSSIWHSKGVMSACFLGWSSSQYIRQYLPVKKPQLLLPVIAAYIPVIQFFLFKTSGFLGAVYGPLITEILTFLPLLLLSVAQNATILENLEIRAGGGRLGWLTDSMPGVLSFAFFKGMEVLSNNTIQRTIGASFIQTRLGLQILLAGLYSIFAPSKLLLYAIPALLHTAIFNTHVPSSYGTNSLKSSMAKNGWTLLDRHESITGYISIFESAEQGFRVMRCDHSLLGGEWLSAPRTNGLAEPIYGVFVMLEAVRLVEVKTPIVDSEAKALVIGLGIGTTPTALIKHGISTTIVEIDPIVHAYATKYFALPSTHTPIIQDAVSYASSLALSSPASYDYIVHDVFTGGAEPVDLFTHEFLSDLNTLLKPTGVIAINYAGDLTLPSAHITIRTILSLFPVCRIFRESQAPPQSKIEAEGRDFTNMVIFCTNAASSSSSFTFRKPSRKDMLGSRAREMFLLPEWEVDLEGFEKGVGGTGVLWKNETESFRAWNEQSALGHWSVMRTVLPGWVWESW